MKGKYIRTPEIKAKMREAKLGEKNPNYGKRGIETSQFGKPAWNKGLTKESDSRIKPSWNLGLTKHTDERVAKNATNSGLSRRGQITWIKGKTKEDYPQLQAWNKGLTKETDPRITLYAEKLNNHPTSEETRNKISYKAKELWENPSHVEKVVKAVLKANHIRPNNSELHLINILDNHFPNEWKYVGGGEVIIERKNPDFININGKKQLIELFGNYWHSEEVIGRTIEEEEKKRIKIFAKYGYDTLIIWEDELQDESSLVQKIREWSNG